MHRVPISFNQAMRLTSGHYEGLVHKYYDQEINCVLYFKNSEHHETCGYVVSNHNQVEKEIDRLRTNGYDVYLEEKITPDGSFFFGYYSIKGDYTKIKFDKTGTLYFPKNHFIINFGDICTQEMMEKCTSGKYLIIYIENRRISF